MGAVLGAVVCAIQAWLKLGLAPWRTARPAPQAWRLMDDEERS